MWRDLSAAGIAICAGGSAFGFEGPCHISAMHPQIMLVQEAGGERWSSPEGISSDFPHLAPGDCARYGDRYGYYECGAIRKNPSPSLHATTAAPIQMDALKAAPHKTAPPIRNAIPSRPLTGQDNRVAKDDRTAEPQSLREVVGHILLARFQGQTSKDKGVIRISRALRHKRIAGVIFEAANIKTPAQVKDLALAFLRTENASTPPLLAVEQPGGPEAALSEEKGFTIYAAPNLVARQQSPYDAQLIYGDMAAELADLGFNLNIGPSTEPCPGRGAPISARCFSIQSSNVAAFSAAFNFAHHDKGILTASRILAKSVAAPNVTIAETPGVLMMRGLANRQPSDALVVHIEPGSSLNAVSQFESADAAGSISVAPVRAPGFEGVIIAEMQTTTSGSPLRIDESAIRALEGGADMIVVPEGGSAANDNLTLVTRAIESAVSSGRIALTRLQESAQRVDKMRYKLQPPQKSAQASRASPQGESVLTANASTRP